MSRWWYRFWLKRRERYEAEQAARICKRHGCRYSTVRIFDRQEAYCDPCAKETLAEGHASVSAAIRAGDDAAAKRWGSK